LKGIPVKFRGCDDSGRTHCGDLVHGRTMGQTYIQILEQANLFDEGDARAIRIRVIPESVRQLVGFDCNGEELYEGDLVCEIVQYSLKSKPLEVRWRAVSSLFGSLYCVKDGHGVCQRIEKDYYSKFYRIDENDEIRDRDGTKLKIEVKREVEHDGKEYVKTVLVETPLEEVKTRCPQVTHARPFYYTVKLGVPKKSECDILVTELENKYKELRDGGDFDFDTQKLLHTAANTIVKLSQRVELLEDRLKEYEEPEAVERKLPKGKVTR